MVNNFLGAWAPHMLILGQYLEIIMALQGILSGFMAINKKFNNLVVSNVLTFIFWV